MLVLTYLKLSHHCDELIRKLAQRADEIATKLLQRMTENHIKANKEWVYQYFLFCYKIFTKIKY